MAKGASARAAARRQKDKWKAKRAKRAKEMEELQAGLQKDDDRILEIQAVNDEANA